MTGDCGFRAYGVDRVSTRAIPKGSDLGFPGMNLRGFGFPYTGSLFCPKAQILLRPGKGSIGCGFKRHEYPRSRSKVAEGGYLNEGPFKGFRVWEKHPA